MDREFVIRHWRVLCGRLSLPRLVFEMCSSSRFLAAFVPWGLLLLLWLRPLGKLQ